MGDEKLLASSAGSTPASTPDEERCLAAAGNKVPPASTPRRWYQELWSLAPLYLTLVSIVQVALWLWSDARVSLLLRWEPLLARRGQAWRLVSYMLLHRGAWHLTINVLLQLLLGAPLEREQGGARTAAMYVAGGVAGALGAALTLPQPLVGASAGVYALLVSHLPHLYLNMSRLKYRKYRVFAVFVLAATDVAWCCVYARTAQISVGAHGAGGAAGALLGLAAYRGDSHRYVRAAAALLAALLAIAALLALLLLPDDYFST